MKKLIFLFVLMWFSFNAAKGVDPSCLFNVVTNGIDFIGNKFYDSTSIGDTITTIVLIDTCGLTAGYSFPYCKDSSFQIYDNIATKEKRFYTNEIFKVNFPYFPFDITNYDMDTVKFFTANDIKQELNQIKDSLLSISNITEEKLDFTRQIKNLKFFLIPLIILMYFLLHLKILLMFMKQKK